MKIESERRCGRVQGRNNVCALVPARQGSGRLSLWCCAITYASMYLCRSVSQAEIGRNRCGCVWVRVEPWRACVRRARRKQRRPSRADWQQREGCHLASGRGSRPGLAQSLLLKSWRRPDRQESACVRACTASSLELWHECCWAYKWRCNPSVISELSPLLVELKPTYRPLERPGRSAPNHVRALFILLLQPARASVRLRAQFQHSSRTGRRLRLVVKLPPFLSSTNRRRGTTRRRRDGSALGVEPVSIKHHPHQTRRKLHW